MACSTASVWRVIRGPLAGSCVPCPDASPQVYIGQPSYYAYSAGWRIRVGTARRLGQPVVGGSRVAVRPYATRHATHREREVLGPFQSDGHP